MKRSRVALLVTLLCSAPLSASADLVTLRFHGTADLTAFGGSASSTFDGRVTWEPLMGLDCQGSQANAYTRCLVDGQPGSVTAGFELEGVDYSARIEPFSRFELWPRALLLQLYFNPLIDLDAGPAPDLLYVDLFLFAPESDPEVFVDFTGPLPADLAFLSRLDGRILVFVDAEYNGLATADTLLVPEPSALALLAVALAAAVRRRTARPSVRSSKPA